MNYKVVFNRLGSLLLVEAALMALPLTVGILYKEKTALAFLVTIVILAIAGNILKIKKSEAERFYAKEGYFLVALTWLLFSAFGALPFFISHAIPNYFDAFFETVSGFTTTGSTILTDIESMPRSLLFWRAFTHFIGGMGILVFVIAIFPRTEGSAMHIMRAESPGPSVGKLVSKLKATARLLYGIYCIMTLVLIILLKAGGMPLFDSVTNAFATAGTGGFCALNNSIEGYSSAYAEVVLGIFMVLFGVNFNLYYLIIAKHGKQALKSEELRWYLGFIAASTFVITLVLTFTRHPFAESLRKAFFQVSSIISTTGFTSTDYDYWPMVCKIVLFLLMFIGSCAGSTGGGIKISRIVVLVKSTIRTVKKAFNPRSVETIKLEGKPLDEDMVHSINSFLSLYMIVMAVSIFVVSIDGKGMVETITSVVTCMNNVGPAFGAIGPSGNFANFSNLTKIVLAFDMLAGRLELIPMFMLFTKYIIPRKYA
ncbi:MAG: TrkH family potassium uptake protein [Clostridia bacterium]|nr:TrkH family potassium uptake protein [Clostridia bacterium]